MYINGVEEESETLIDNDANTCVDLIGSDGCTMDRVNNILVSMDRAPNLSFNGHTSCLLYSLFIRKGILNSAPFVIFGKTDI